MNQQAVAWASPNIALVKYWGKMDGPDNRPAVSSLSMTLADIGTLTRVAFDVDLKSDELCLNGAQEEATRQRVVACLDDVRRYAQSDCKARVHSENNFPTGAGLASSASGFAALALAASAALHADVPKAELSRIARRASGSAARSLWGGYVMIDAALPDPCAEPLYDLDYFPLDVVIAVVSKSPKSIGSTAGMMNSRRTSDYYPAWIDNQEPDIQKARTALAMKDFEQLAEVSEVSCLKMHALMMATRPPLMYWLPETLACIQVVLGLRKQGVGVFFTIDAGPQVKAFCLPEAGAKVSEALSGVPGVLEIIHTRTGDDARLLDGGEAERAAMRLLKMKQVNQ